jgi:hypothetical protein
VLLSAGLTAMALTDATVGLPLQWRIGPAAKDIGSSNYIQVPHTYGGIGARPLAPVHLRGVRRGGDLDLSWIRRTRRGGDTWASIDVPLAEASEQYEVDILDGAHANAVVTRTLSSATSTVTYTAVMQATDFGAIPSSVSVKIYQISATWGRGAAASGTV